MKALVPHLPGEGLYIDFNTGAGPSLTHSPPHSRTTFFLAGPDHHIASSGCSGAHLNPNTISPAQETVECTWARTPNCQARMLMMLWGAPGPEEIKCQSRMSE